MTKLFIDGAEIDVSTRHEIEKRIDDYAANPHSERIAVAAE